MYIHIYRVLNYTWFLGEVILKHSNIYETKYILIFEYVYTKKSQITL